MKTLKKYSYEIQNEYTNFQLT